MVQIIKGEDVLGVGRLNQDSALRISVWVLFGFLVARFVADWINAFTGASLPVPGRIGFTVLFTSFALAHATSQLGWRRALVFLVACAAVSWSFEEVGIATGRVYGPYHYGAQLGAKLGDVPVIIPFAWFMMIYASWVVARLLLEGAGDPFGWPATLSRVVVASFAMTAWDTVMDPGMARSGVWTWDRGGDYFGVPLQNFAGWLATTLVVYMIAEWAMRQVSEREPAPASRAYFGLPALLYALVALDRLLLPDFMELRVVAAFGMGLVALLAGLRLALSPRV